RNLANNHIVRATIFRPARLRNDKKDQIKDVFKFQSHATQMIPSSSPSGNRGNSAYTSTISVIECNYR
ncbi:hypothetical protein LINGRAHAP2_LOCUS7544, partial [Linum grandiflorum]